MPSYINLIKVANQFYEATERPTRISIYLGLIEGIGMPHYDTYYNQY